MQVDFELYRQDIVVSRDPVVRLSVIDVAPERPQETLVMLHGFGGHATQWHYQLRDFSDRNRCIAIDLRGHGHSDKPLTEYTMDEMVEDVRAVLDALQIDTPIILLGHSFGGALAASFAHRYPDRVQRLVLTATAYSFQVAFYTRLLVGLPLPVVNIIHRLAARQISASAAVVKRFFHNALNIWDGRQILSELTMPVLVIRGDRDLVFPSSRFSDVPKIVPNAEDVNLGVSKHMVILERHDAVRRAIERFLGQGGDTWRRQGPEVDDRVRLLAARPWLAHYEDVVPLTLSIPQRPLFTLLSSAARRFPNRPATIFANRVLTYRQIERQANRLANALRGMGVDTGMRVMILLPNLPQWVIGLYGVLKAGGVIVGASPMSPPGELVREIEDSDAQILITMPRFQETARRALDQTGLQQVIYTGIDEYLAWWQKVLFRFRAGRQAENRLSTPLRPDERRWVDLMRGYRANPLNIHVEPSSLALIQYTGGTTANPKGVMLSHRALVANAFQMRHWFPGLKDGRESVLCVVPFGHSYGLVTMSVGISIAAALVILPGFVPLNVLNAIKKHRPSLFPGVPTMYVALNRFPGVRRFRLDSIKACMSGAAPLPVEVQETFEKLSRGRLVEGYGLTEAGPATHANPIFGMRRAGSIGLPLPNTEARIVHLVSGRDLPPGEIGELVLRGPQVMDGYWGHPDATAQALRDGWLFTGDVARMDSDGYFQIISRKKDMWYSERADTEPYPAFPRDVEEVIYELPEVSECAVVGIANRPVAFVTVSRPLEAQTITGYCARRLPPELVPMLVFFVDEMPKSFVGKIIRRALLDHIPEPQRRELDIVSDRIDEMLTFPVDHIDG